MATTSSPHGNINRREISPTSLNHDGERAGNPCPSALNLSPNLTLGDEDLENTLLQGEFSNPSYPATPSNSPARSCSPLELPGPEFSPDDGQVPVTELVTFGEHKPTVTDSCSLKITPADVSMALAPCPPLPWRKEPGHGLERKVTEGVVEGARAREKATVATTTSTRAGPHSTPLANCATKDQPPSGMEEGPPGGASSPSISSFSTSKSPFSSSTSSYSPTTKSSSSASSPSSYPSSSSFSTSAMTCPIATGTSNIAQDMRARDAHSLSAGDKPIPCSPLCAQRFARLSGELSEMKDQLFALSVQMEEQSSHITKLMEENRRYIRENGKLKSRTRGGVVNSASNYTDSFSSADNYTDGFGSANTYSDGFSTDCSQQSNAGDLEDRVLALQLQNSELALCLEKEKRRRREAETRLERDEGYIKRLEDSVQTLRGTRVVMDPITYRQVAEAYIAARRTPARRPHTHTGVTGSHLVCDGSSSVANQRLSHPAMHTGITTCTTSSSPLDSSSTYLPDTESSHMYSSSAPSQEAVDGSSSLKGHSKKKGRCFPPQEQLSRGSSTSVNGNMNPWDYQQLLESLEDLDGGSRGALS